MKINYFIISMFFLSAILVTSANAGNVTEGVGWNIELNDDGTCSLGNTYEYGSRDSVIVAITSYGQVSILADREFTGDIVVDGGKEIYPTNTMSGGIHMYSNSNNKDNGKLFISYFRAGNTASIKLKNGDNRVLSLAGFTAAHNKYKKCAR